MRRCASGRRLITTLLAKETLVFPAPALAVNRIWRAGERPVVKCGRRPRRWLRCKRILARPYVDDTQPVLKIANAARAGCNRFRRRRGRFHENWRLWLAGKCDDPEHRNREAHQEPRLKVPWQDTLRGRAAISDSRRSRVAFGHGYRPC